MKRLYGVLCCVVSLLIAPVSAGAQTAQIGQPVRVFTPSLAITTTGKNSQPISPGQALKTHKAVVLVFLANRCGVTWLYADKLIALQKRYDAPGKVAFYGVHSAFEETGDELTAEMLRRKLSLPVIDDKPAQTLADYFGASVTPYFVVIDNAGVLRYKGSFEKMGGSLPDAQRAQYLRLALDAVLAGKPVATPVVRALGCEITRRRR